MRYLKKHQAGALLFAATLALVGCGTNPGVSSAESLGDPTKYEVSLTYVDGTLLSSVDVFLTSSGGTTFFGTTDARGIATIDAPETDYAVTVDGLPDGYYIDDITLNSGVTEADITVKSRVITEGTVPELYHQGDIIYDYTFVNSEGETKSISEELKTKQLVVLNFWYKTCYWCNVEFPFMQEVYSDPTISANMSIFALTLAHNNATVADYKAEKKLTFDMGFDTDDITDHFEYTGMPFSVFVDRYGRIDHIENGALQSLEEVEDAFTYYLGDDYKPVKESSDIVYPDIEMPASSVLEAVANAEGFDGTYRPETGNDAPLSWPFVVAQDGKSIQPSNRKVNNSFSILYCDIHLKKDQVFAFDYLCSTEQYADIFYVFVDREAICAFSGVESDWKTCYAFAAKEEKDYEIAFLYMKDEDGFSGQDTVFLKNLRYMDAEDVTEPFYVIRQCADGEIKNGRWTNYITPVFNEADGYYHVDSLDGPLVLANLNYTSHFADQFSIYDYAAEGQLGNVNGVNYNNLITKYAGYAGSTTVGYATLNQELKEALSAITAYIAGVDYEEQYLETCVYYDAYGTGGKQLEDPLAGIAWEKALPAHLGDDNYAVIDHVIMPRGVKFSFTAPESGVYNFESFGDKETDCFLYNAQGKIVDQSDEVWLRSVVSTDSPNPNFQMWHYLEKGETIYVAVAYYDIYECDTIRFGIHYVGETYDAFVACSPGYYTTSGVDKDGNPSGEIIRLGIDIKLGEDGYYHELRADGTLGSIVYADFSAMTSLFSRTLAEFIKNGGFDCTVDENGDPVEGGVDHTAEVKSIYNKSVILDDGETFGCVPVTERLGEILQDFMNKYSFPVKENWLKLCYYFQHYGK